MTFASRFFGSHCVGSVHIFWTFFLSLCHPVKPSTSGHKKCETNAKHKTKLFFRFICVTSKQYTVFR